MAVPLWPDRPFTAPAKNSEDTANLESMLRELRHWLRQPARPLFPLVFDLQQPDPRRAVDGVCNTGGRQYRIAFLKEAALRRHCNLVVVGFCGRKQPGADRTLVEAIDNELIAEFPQHPHFLSYSSLELVDGNWCNLVLFDHWDGLAHWNNSPRHWQAAREIAPSYYQCIRLHNGIVPDGLMEGGPLILLRTKYFDFSHNGFWHGIREWGHDQAGQPAASSTRRA